MDGTSELGPNSRPESSDPVHENARLRERIAELEARLLDRGAPSGDFHTLDYSQITTAALSEIIEYIAVSAFLIDADFKIVTCNRKYFEEFPGRQVVLKPGLTLDSVYREIGERGYLPLTDLTPTQWRRRQIERFKSGEAFTVKFPDGRIMQVTPKRTADGGTLVLRRNITELAKERAARRETQQKFDLFTRNSPDLYWLQDPKSGKLTFLGPNFEKIWGFDADVLVDDPNHGLQLIHPEDVARFKKSQKIRKRKSGEVEFRMLRPDGKERWLRGRWTPVRNNDGKVECIFGVTQDITEIKAADGARQESENKFRGAFEHAGVGMAIVVPGEKFSAVNRTLCKMLGYTEEELLAKTVVDVTHPDFIPELLAERHRILNGAAPRQNIERCLVRSDGKPVWILLNRAKIENIDGTVKYFIAQYQDITERKAADEALKQSETRLRDFAAVSADRFWETDADHRFTKFFVLNDGLPNNARVEAIGKTRWEWAGEEPDDKNWRRHIRDLNAHRPFRNFRYTKRSSVSGEIVHLCVSGIPVFDDDGKFAGYRGTAVDETAEVEARASAEKAQARLIAAIDGAPRATTLWGPDGRMVYCNREYLKLYPHLKKFAKPGVTIEALLAPHVKAGWYVVTEIPASELIAKWHTEHPVNSDHDLETSNGKRWVMVRSRKFEDGSSIKFHTEVTAQKNAEIAVRESEKRFRTSFDHTRMPMAMISPKFGFMRTNRAFTRLFGYSKSELANMKPTDLVHPDDRAQGVALRDAIYSKGRRASADELRFVHKRGHVIWCEINSTGILDAEGNVDHQIAQYTDITDSKRTHEALRDSEAHFRSSFDESQVPMAMISSANEFLRTNRVFSKWLGYAQADLARIRPIELIHPDDRDWVTGRRSLILSGRRRSTKSEFRVVHKDGRVFWCRAHATAIRDADGNTDYRIVHYADITEAKRAEEVIQNDHEILASIASGTPLREVLQQITRSVERLNPDHRCAILLYDRESNTLQIAAAESLSDAFHRVVERVPVGPGATSCGVAADTGKRVVVEDLSVSQGGMARQNAAIAEGMRSCVSQPIISADKQVLGTLAVYSAHAGKPNRADLSNIASAASLAGIAISGEQVKKEIRTAAEKVSSTIGNRYFRSLVEYLQDVLAVDYAFVGKVKGSERDRVETIAVQSGGRLTENFVYMLKGSPCEMVANQKPSFYGQGVTKKFPADELLPTLGIEAYAGMPLKDSAGRVIGLLVVLSKSPMMRSEMTMSLLQIFAARAAAELERMGIEQDLRESETRMLDFASATADTFWESDNEHRLVYVSSPMDGSTGDFSGRVIGSRLWEIPEIEVDPAALRDHRKILDAHEPFRDFRFIRTDSRGRRYHMRASGKPLFDENGRFEGYRGTSVDETDAIESQHAAETAHQRFLNALNNAPDGTTYWDADGRLVMANTHFIRISPDAESVLVPGVTFEEFIAARVASGTRLGDSTDDTAKATNMRIMEAYRSGHAEYEFARGQKWFRNRIRRLDDGSTIMYLSDVTEIRRREEEFRQALKMEAVGNLTGGVAHDFNNILAAALGNLELVQTDVQENERASVRVERAIKAVQRGGELTKRLLAFSRKQTLESVPTDLRGLIQDTVDLLKRTLGERISIRSTFEANLWPALVDRNQLETALVNLAINARDAMPGGGNIDFEGANFRRDGDHARAGQELKPGDYIALTVRDDGSGIEPEHLSMVFDPFFTTKDVGQGSGLGLSQVYGFVKQSGGHVEIESALGEGTAVRIYLPRSAIQESADLLNGRDSDLPQGHGESVLVIEDDPEVRHVTISMLEGLGYDTIDGGDGGELDQKLGNDAESIDLVLTDVILPGGLTGPDIAEHVRRTHVETKILLMTGYAEGNVLLSEGAHLKFPLLHKPFEVSTLARKIRDTLDGKGSRRNQRHDRP